MERKQSDTALVAQRPLRVGVTGHTDLSEATTRLVAEALREQLRLLVGTSSECRPFAGVSCLARGSDCVFAEVVLGLGGSLEVILPSADYFASQVSDRYEGVFDGLLRRAGSVRNAGCATAGPQAYAAANDLLLDSVDRLFAVWDGIASDEVGGTAHAVGVARTRRLPVTVIWPEGAQRG